MLIVGIDIGTSFSSITVLKNGSAEPVRIKTGDSVFGDSFSMPTVVYADNDGTLKLGQMAFNKQAREPERFKKDFKRVFGTTTPFVLGDGQYLPEDLYTKIFQHFKQKCEEQYGDKIGMAYITHPASYNSDKKRLLEYAANNAGLSGVVLLEEPTAAAIAYSKKEQVSTGEVLLIYDLGGGTFDVALIKKNEQTGTGFIPLTEPQGIAECGGIDFDRAISEDLLKTLREKGFDVDTEMQIPRFTVKLPEICARLKHQLTEETYVEESIDIENQYVDYTLTRERFEALIRPYVNATMEKVSAILQEAGIEPGQLHHVVLVGGSTQIPLVREVLRERFGSRVNVDIDPVMAVASGAVLRHVAIQEEEQRKAGQLVQERKEHEEALLRQGAQIERERIAKEEAERKELEQIAQQEAKQKRMEMDEIQRKAQELAAQMERERIKKAQVELAEKEPVAKKETENAKLKAAVGKGFIRGLAYLANIVGLFGLLDGGTDAVRMANGLAANNPLNSLTFGAVAVCIGTVILIALRKKIEEREKYVV